MGSRVVYSVCGAYKQCVKPLKLYGSYRLQFIKFRVCDARPQPISRLEPFQGFKREAQQQCGGGGGGAPPGNGHRAPLKEIQEPPV